MADLRQSLGQSIVLAAPGRLYACWREKHRALTWWRSHHRLSGLMVACMLDLSWVVMMSSAQQAGWGSRPVREH